ncbi:EamA family transporter RarD [Vibrio sp. vnigr-6D03]|uniref:EamA family transporter n=1 Tax=Vibrio sp. vnigr-6D03 TaxID=2058088 RepID=UPI000C326F52|nr:EamA family transporter RarD [Vibrio sp. vnigr-6D03]PKF81535.1 EamA family transporter RarD [Vibrio sp. vnigr-6D03]
MNQVKNTSTDESRGIMASIMASIGFAMMPAYVTFQPEITGIPTDFGMGNWLAGQRILWGSILLLFGLALFGRLPTFWSFFSQWRLWPRYMLSAILIAPQLWVFVWAPLQGETLSVALGYFCLPLTLAAVAHFVYKESITRKQLIACAFAACGVAYAYAMADGVSWIVFLICFGYPMYFMFRRKYKISSDMSFSLENVFLLPFAIIGMALTYPIESWGSIAPSAWLYYLGLAFTGIIPIILFFYASQLLPMTLFGLLGYLEPVLVFCVALVLGERIALIQWPTYLAIIVALAIVALEQLKLRRSLG